MNIKMIKLSVCLILVVVLSRCTNSCITWGEKYFRPVKLNFVLTEKRIEFEKELVFEGKTPEGKPQSMMIPGVYSFYETAAVGDTIRKDSGDMRMYCIKKDTTIVFTYHCVSPNSPD